MNQLPFLCCAETKEMLQQTTQNWFGFWVFHHAAMYFPQMGHETEWDHMVFAFVGDLVHQQIQTVSLPVDAFHQVPVFIIPSAIRLANEFAADPTTELVGPYTNNNPEIEPFRT